MKQTIKPSHKPHNQTQPMQHNQPTRNQQQTNTHKRNPTKHNIKPVSRQQLNTQTNKSTNKSTIIKHTFVQLAMAVSLCASHFQLN
jgi:hypothetical protein